MALIAYPRIDPVLLHIGAIQVRWYGLAYLLGFVLAALIVRALVRRWRLDVTDGELLDVVLASVIGLIVGARLGYVLFYGLEFVRSPIDVIAVWDGGMSFHGGLAGLVLVGFLFGRRLRVPPLRLLDLGAAAAPPGLFLGRVANFINGELFGRPSNLPWAMVFPGGGPPRHPSQLYEALLEGAVLFAVLWALSRRVRPPGVVFGAFLALYGVFRFLVEFAREPDPQLGYVLGPFSMGQLLSLPMVMAGVALVLWAGRRATGR